MIFTFGSRISIGLLLDRLIDSHRLVIEHRRLILLDNVNILFVRVFVSILLWNVFVDITITEIELIVVKNRLIIRLVEHIDRLLVDIYLRLD